MIFIRTEPLQSLRRATSFLLLRLTFCRGRTCALMKNTERRKRKNSHSLQLQLSNFLTLLSHHPLVSGVWVRLQRFTFRIILKFHVPVFASLILLSFVSSEHKPLRLRLSLCHFISSEMEKNKRTNNNNNKKQPFSLCTLVMLVHNPAWSCKT